MNGRAVQTARDDNPLCDGHCGTTDRRRKRGARDSTSRRALRREDVTTRDGRTALAPLADASGAHPQSQPRQGSRIKSRRLDTQEAIFDAVNDRGRL